MAPPKTPSQTHRLFPSLLSALALLLTTGLLASPALADRPEIGFLTPISMPVGPEVWISTLDGEELTGELRSASGFGSATKLKIRLANGEKRKFRATELRQVRMPVNDFVRGLMIGEATNSVEKAIKTDYEPIFEVDELVFDSILHPKSDRIALRQRLNPGYDWRIQVYDLPLSKEWTLTSKKSGISWFGDEPEAFLVVKDGGEPMRVRENDYRKHHFEQLFGDCPAILERYQGKKRKFRFFAEHTYEYHQACPKPGESTPTVLDLPIRDAARPSATGP